MNLRALPVIAAVASLAGVPLHTQANTGTRPLVSAELSGPKRALDAFHGALRAGNRSAAFALLAEDALIYESGHAERKSQYATHHLDADIAFARAVSGTTLKRCGRRAGRFAWLLLGGAITAGLAHILAGHLSDRWLRRHGSRRGLIAIGLAALMVAFALLAAAHTTGQLTGAVIIFQVALNFAFAPLGALLSDHVPDSSKGTVAGLLNAALPLSSGGIVLLAWLYPTDTGHAFIMNAVLVAACMLPLLISWAYGLTFEPRLAKHDPERAHAPLRRDFMLAWLARFLVQLGAAIVIGFTCLLVSDRIKADPGWAGGRGPSQALTLLSLAVMVVAVSGSVAGGRLSDRFGRRRVPLAVAAMILASSMTVLGSRADWPLFLAAYATFHLALAVFLAIDSALVAQLVGGNPHCGSMLGVMNLANTLPGVLAPVVAITSLNLSQSSGLLDLLLFAGGAAASCAALTVMFIRGVN